MGEPVQVLDRGRRELGAYGVSSESRTGRGSTPPAPESSYILLAWWRGRPDRHVPFSDIMTDHRSRVRVYIACSLDGLIAGKDDDLSWLPEDPPEEDPEPGALS